MMANVETGMKRKYNLTEQEMSVILRDYDGRTETIDKIVNLLGDKYPRWHIRKVAAENGLSRPDKVRPWAEKDEDFLVKHYSTMCIATLCKRLKRSRTAIALKKKRLGLAKNGDGFTMHQITGITGADHHKIRKWIDKGWLKAKHKNTERTEAQGDMWHVKSDDMRSFLIEHWEEIDIRRVDSYSFIQLVAGNL